MMRIDFITVIIESLQQHIATLTRNSRTAIRLIGLSHYSQTNLPVCHADGNRAFARQDDGDVPVAVTAIRTRCTARGIYRTRIQREIPRIVRNLELIRTRRQVLKRNLIIRQSKVTTRIPRCIRETGTRQIINHLRLLISTPRSSAITTVTPIHRRSKHVIVGRNSLVTSLAPE